MTALDGLVIPSPMYTTTSLKILINYIVHYLVVIVMYYLINSIINAIQSSIIIQLMYVYSYQSIQLWRK